MENDNNPLPDLPALGINEGDFEMEVIDHGDGDADVAFNWHSREAFMKVVAAAEERGMTADEYLVRLVAPHARSINGEPIK